VALTLLPLSSAEVQERVELYFVISLWVFIACCTVNVTLYLFISQIIFSPNSYVNVTFPDSFSVVLRRRLHDGFPHEASLNYILFVYPIPFNLHRPSETNVCL